MQILENTTISEDLIITSQITITGEVIVNSNITVKAGGHLVIRGATLYFDQNCGIISEGVIEAISSTFDAKGSQWGTITFKEKSSKNSLIKNCTILHGGGIVIEETASNIVIDTCTISDCTAEVGGAIESSGENIIIRNCTISDCKANSYGGGIYITKNSSTLVEKCRIEDCVAKNGAGISVYNRKTPPNDDRIIYKCTIQNCEAKSDGGGIYFALFDASDKAILDCTISNCRANKEGGGIYIKGNGTIKNTKINNCIAKYYGGGISCKENIYIESSTVYQCIANEGGGIAIPYGGKVFFENTEIIECKANSDGGGMMVQSNAEILSSTPTKIVKCKSFQGIHGAANAIYFNPTDQKQMVDNFLFIDCIEDIDVKNEYLLSLNTLHSGYAEVNNCRAYNILSDGSIQEYNIKDFSRSSSQALEIDGESV